MDRASSRTQIKLSPKQRTQLDTHAKSAARVIRRRQKALKIVCREPYLVLEGDFYLFEGQLPFDHFEVQISIPPAFPNLQPFVVAVGDRILPKTGERHINEDGTCCIGVWEQWLFRENDLSVENFLNGIVHGYFIQQHAYEETKIWPAGDLPHYGQGLVVAFADIIGVKSKEHVVRRYLDVLATAWPKGHQLCPCLSGKSLNNYRRVSVGSGLWLAI